VARVRASARSRSGNSLALFLGVALIVGALVALGALAYFYWAIPRPPELRVADLCPVSGPQGVEVVLVDTSDDLLPATQKEVRSRLDDIISELPPYYMLDIRVLDIPNLRSRSLFSKCNPGNGEGVSELTDNPALRRMRWLQSFNTPAEEAIGNSLRSAKSKSSPIMAAIQDIALDDFSGGPLRDLPKTLTIISDMLEFTPYYGQYPGQGDLSYERFKRSAAYQKFKTDLHGARVTIDYVGRPEIKIDTRAHAMFWGAWITDNKGTIDAVHRLQG
jgi:hypothetical protein